MMSLASTHLILHYHRKVLYHSTRKVSEQESDPEQTAENGKKTAENGEESKPAEGMKGLLGLSNRFLALACLSIIGSMAFYIVGCVINIYEVTNTRGSFSFVEDYSVVSVGTALPMSVLDPSDLGTRFIQAMWFFLCVVMPLWCTFLFGVLFLYPLSRQWMERVFVMAEIAFAWSCAEVLLISTIFAVSQMPSFGDGLIDADCTACFVVDTEILPQFAFLGVGTILNVLLNVWLYRKAHYALYKQ
jgi:hypothetical protein